MKGLRKLALLLSVSALASAVAGELKVQPEQLESRYRAKTAMKDGAISIQSDTPEWDSGLRINPPKGTKFDFSGAKYLAVDVENCSKDRQLRMTMCTSQAVRATGRKAPVTLICRTARPTPESV